MRLIPNHSVFYDHVLHQAGEAFEIDPKDADEMKQYGQLADEAPEATEPPKRGGRPKKNA